MSGPVSILDVDWGNGEPKLCPDPETCTEIHNEEDPHTGEQHHYGCECNWCSYLMWALQS